MSTIGAALAEARGSGVARLDAQLLLAHLLGVGRAWLVAHDDAPLSDAQQHDYRALCRRAADGEPVAYLLGEREFHGLRLAVGPAVLVPRPDTETLVDWALERLAGTTDPTVLDLGTGSGAIALAIAHRAPRARVTAVDIDPAALAIARRNGTALGLAMEWLEGRWYAPVAGRRFGLIVANPPYLADDDPHLPGLRHEPRHALVAGDGGLADLAEIAAGAPAHLAPGGELLVEHGWEQADAVQALLHRHGFDGVETRRDIEGRPRCTGGRLHAASPRGSPGHRSGTPKDAREA